jgi:hypothetical protein
VLADGNPLAQRWLRGQELRAVMLSVGVSLRDGRHALHLGLSPHVIVTARPGAPHASFPERSRIHHCA